MNYTLEFSDEDTKNLNAALAARPNFATIEEFLQAHCQGAVDAGKQDRRAAAVAQLIETPDDALPEFIRVEKIVERVVEVVASSAPDTIIK